jgi:LuxR family maltose regulon positive regulatory protein
MDDDTRGRSIPAERTETAADLVHAMPPTYAFAAVRTRAFDAIIDPAAPAKITSVVAPPGYGKTVLLAEAYRHFEALGQRCLWIGIDAQTIGEVFPVPAMERLLGIEQRNASNALDYRRPKPLIDRLRQILGALAAELRPTILFIDNADLANSAVTRELVNALVFETSPDIRLVVSGGTRIAFDETRAVLELRMRTVGPAELGFGAAEVEALFRDAAAAPPTGTLVRHVLERSDGWPAAVRLMQVLASTTGGTLLDGDGLAGGNERIADSLFDRLLDRLPAPLQDFLMEISAYSSFSHELVRHATQSDKAGDYIDYLIGNNVLIVALDDSGGWYRFHTLFRAYLSRIAQARLDEQRRRDVVLLGAQWLERHNHITASLDLAMAIQDRRMCVRLLEKLSWTLVRGSGHLPNFIASAEKVRRLGFPLGPEAGFWFAWALIFERRYEDAGEALAQLREENRSRDTSAGRKRLVEAKSGLAEIVLKLHLDDLHAVQTLAPAWLHRFSDIAAFERGAAAGALALAHLADFRFPLAISSSRMSVSAVAPTTSLYGQAWASGVSAAIAIATGNADGLEQTLLPLERQIRAELGDDSLMAAVMSTLRARELYDRGEIDPALDLATGALRLVRDCGMLDFIWIAFEALAPPILLDGKGAIGIGDLRQIAAAYPKRLATLLDLLLIRLHASRGETDRAIELAQRTGIWNAAGGFAVPADLVFESERAAANATGIVLLTLQGNVRGARDLVDAEMKVARQKGRRGAVMELYLALAAIEMKSGQPHDAMRAFSRALNLGAESRLVRPFYEQRQLVAHLLAVAQPKALSLATDTARQFFDQVSATAGAVAPEPAVDEHGDAGILTEPLTRRELELLRMVASGLDNAQISASSMISIPTVKWHLRNLFAKMDVKNRTSAVARARELHLL